MKGIVKESVIYKGVIYQIGDHIEVDDVIGASLLARGCIKEYSEATVKAKWNKEDLETWKMGELKRLAAELGIEATGKKAELIEKICAVEVEIPEEAIVNVDENGVPVDEVVTDENQEAPEEESEEGPNTGMPE